MNKLKRIAIIAAGMAAAVSLSACSGSLDVVGQQSAASFGEVLKAIPDKVKADETNGGWALSAPDESVRFIWSGDIGKSPSNDVMLEIDAQPFLDAGLDPAKLPGNYAFNEGGGDAKTLTVGRKLEGGKPAGGSAATALAAYERIATEYRDSVNYHTNLDHFGVMLGDGNMFEWAKDMKTNGFDGSDQDKDIVFVLNPEPLIAAGADPEKVDGWVYTQVEVDQNGKTELVWKLLKPFNLK